MSEAKVIGDHARDHDADSWNAGYWDGQSGELYKPPKDCDRQSYCQGFIEGRCTRREQNG